uniref:G-protein coupled receptors family 1 profile domain-containing protein n=1 Tax=Nomascus leucogenys TaxID=61853 RepID=A0A2I3HB49_NOMLE
MPMQLLLTDFVIFSIRFIINSMEARNQTAVSEFLLLGLIEDPELQPVLFSLFLSMYLVTILGNLLILLAVISDSHLHTPMYFFLSNLSFSDICLSTTTIPKMLVNIQSQNRATHTQAASPRSALSWFLLAWKIVSLQQWPMTFAACIFGGVPLSGIIFSYTQIASSVLRMPSASGKHKAFSTCGSHLSVVLVFYGAGLGVYISSAVTDSPRKTAVASVMYSVVPQMVNPFIYSLRNKDMKGTLRRFIGRIPSLLWCAICFGFRFLE